MLAPIEWSHLNCQQVPSFCLPPTNLRIDSKSGDIRDLRGTVEREGAAIGVFITLDPPTNDMRTEAASAGFYHSPHWGDDFPKIQILSIPDLLAGGKIKMPPEYGTFKQAQRVQPAGAKQLGFEVE